MADAARRLRLYNTLTRTKEDFVPIDAANVRMYACGPTVYDYAHIGNARPVIVFDVLFRLLRHLYGEAHVTYVRNITDVDDKINARAARDYPGLPLNEAIRKVTEETNAQYQRDVKALGALEPTFQPRATEYIDEMRAMIERLVAVGVGYVAEDHVLFSPSAMNERIAVLGRPGWHIECSAMSMAKLLEPFGGGLGADPAKNVFDIHAGGIDLVFPHHENEIAQSCSAFGSERMANYWLHNGFLQVEGRKMSKSLGNFVTINELLATDTFGGRKWPGEVLRLAMLMTHYREPIDFSLRKLEEATSVLERWADAVEGSPAGGEEALALAADDPLLDDLNVSALVPRLHDLARDARAGDAAQKAAMRSYLGLLGLDTIDRFSSAARSAPSSLDAATAARVEAAIERRLALIRDKNWKEADLIRDKLLADGIQLKDGKDPASGERTTTWEVKR
jgi:cysteinyl-tRNA synthetase